MHYFAIAALAALLLAAAVVEAFAGAAVDRNVRATAIVIER